MSTTYPIKNEEKLRKFKEYYLTIKPMCRNYAMIILGLNTAFRISDLLKLQWQDVFNHKKNCFKDHICITEQKTGKEQCVAINANVFEALHILQEEEPSREKDHFLFTGKEEPRNTCPAPRPSA